MRCRKGRQPRRKTICLLPADVVEKIENLFDGRNRDDAISLVNKIYSSRNYNQVDGTLVSSNYYKKCLRRSATDRVFIALRDNEILEVSKPAITKVKAAWYRVNSMDPCNLQKVEYQEVFNIIPPEEMDTLCRKVGLFVNELRPLVSNKFIADLADKIIIDRIDNDGFYNFPNGNRKHLSQNELEVQRSKIIKKHTDTLSQINEDHINQKQPKRNETNNRMNYSLTRLNSKYHSKLVWKGKETIEESDLSNSQPILLIALLEGRFSDQLLRRLSCDNYKFQNLNSTITNIGIDNTTIGTIEGYIQGGVSSVGASSIISSGVHNSKTLMQPSFKSLTKSSELYKYICDVKGWDITKPEHKKRAKEYVFGCIYGSFRPTRAIGKNRRKFMNEHFPDILKAIDKIKKSFVPHFQRMKKNNPEQFNSIAHKNGETRSPSKMASNALSVLLQRLESYLFIDKILKECIRKYPCATKHDALIYPKSYKNKIDKIMKKILDQYLGEGNYSI